MDGWREQRGVGSGDLAVADELAEDGARRSAAARSADMTTTAAPPSEICDAFPAVIVPVGVEGRPQSWPSDSAVVPGRDALVGVDDDGSPLRWGTSTATISSANSPSLIAAAAARGSPR